MNSKNWQPNEDDFNFVATIEADAAKMRKDARDNNDSMKADKMRAYAKLAANIWSVSLVKGNMPKTVRVRFAEALRSRGGISDAMIERYTKNVAGISRMRKEWDIPSQATADLILGTLLQRGIDSENALTKALAGDAETDSHIENVVKQFVGSFSYRKDEDGSRVPGIWKPGKYANDFGDLIEALNEARKIFEAAQNEATQKEGERVTYQAVMETLRAMEQEAEQEAA